MAQEIDDHVLFASVRSLGERLRGRRVSPVALTEAYLQRLEKVGPRLGAVVTVLPSIGVCIAEHPAEETIPAERMLNVADQAMYVAKREKRGSAIMRRSSAWKSRSSPRSPRSKRSSSASSGTELHNANERRPSKRRPDERLGAAGLVVPGRVGRVGHATPSLVGAWSAPVDRAAATASVER